MKVIYEFIEAKEFFVFFKENRIKVFTDNFDFDIDKILTTEEQENRERNHNRLKDAYKYYLVAKTDNKIIGWSFGMQKSADDYYMINSAVFPEYRKLGIYTEMLEMSVDLIKSQGFQRIYSKHKMSNNAILIPKLKFGFVITGFEVNDVFGSLVELSYYTNSIRRELLEVRIGTRKMNVDTLNMIK